MKRILFICTGNIFRSLTAEKCFKQYVADNGIDGWQVGSAGTQALPANIDPKLAETLREVGVTDLSHQQRRVSAEILRESDIVVAMAQDHVDFLVNELGYTNALLFNLLALGQPTSVPDVEDYVLEPGPTRPAVERVIEETVVHIHQGTPALFQNVSLRFDEFLALNEKLKTAI